MSLWSGRTRVPEPPQDDLSFRAEVQSAVEVMTNHRLKDAREVLATARRAVGKLEPSPARTLAFDALVDADRLLGGGS